MKIYELTYIIPSDLANEESGVVTKKIESVIRENEGTILKCDGPVPKTLAYPIKAKGSGFFHILEFQLNPEKISELKEKIEKEPKIIRHMLLAKKPERKIKENKRKSRFIAESEFSFISPFSSKKDDLTEEPNKTMPPTESKEEKKQEKQEKVELKDIEKKLDELLNE